MHGQSAYVSGLVAAIDSVAEVVRGGIEQKKYWRNWIDKAAKYVFLSRMSETPTRLTVTCTV